MLKYFDEEGLDSQIIDGDVVRSFFNDDLDGAEDRAEHQKDFAGLIIIRK